MRSPDELEREINERKQAQEEILRLNVGMKQWVNEVESANQQLEAFSYSVSHDLRAPLRAMDGYSRILLESHASGPPEATEHYLRLIRKNALRMGQLIDDLLGFSRLGRQPLRVQCIAPGEIVREVLAELGGEREGRQADIRVGDLPACKADPALLKQVYANLLDNALKYTREREQAAIEVGCRSGDTDSGEHIYFVRDNGVGFDMAYVDKLFGVFQRLHRPEDYEGTGVGLATVKRIIQRHEGRIWAEAEVDHGATFYFTLKDGSNHDRGKMTRDQTAKARRPGDTWKDNPTLIGAK
jgi:light-regulated signal transduction histidine kinase (bacteriophytochrome)